MEPLLTELATSIGQRCRELGVRLVTAESCTGGWVARVLTEIPGSSGWFDRGFVTYSNQSKQEMLGVSAEILDTQGAVSEATVLQMASGALLCSSASLSVAISGIAGPDGGTAEKPVGTVWFAWGLKGGELSASMVRFSGNREQVRRQAVETALRGVLEHLG